MKKFIPCGFEFTIARIKDVPLVDEVFEDYLNDNTLTKKQIEIRKQKLEKEELKQRKRTTKSFEQDLLDVFGIKMKLPLAIAYDDRESVKKDREKCKAALEKENRNSESVTVKVEGNSPSDSIYVYSKHRKKLSPYKWINKRFSSDSCGAEISTPIVKSQEDVVRYYKELTWLTKKYNLTVDGEIAQCPLGGCHIHKSLEFFNEVEKHYFIKNIAIFMTNYPELNWGFNEPFDNWNANSLLAPVKHVGENFGLDSSGVNYRYLRIKDEEGNNKEITKIIYKKNGGLYKFRKDNNAFRAMMSAPLEGQLNKRHAFRYNKHYNTVEFRIFDMPNTLRRHILHHEVADKIYRICYDYAKRKDTMELTYTEFDYNLERSINRFYECMKILGIKKSRVGIMIENIKTRYAWNEEQTEENYLL